MLVASRFRLGAVSSRPGVGRTVVVLVVVLLIAAAAVAAYYVSSGPTHTGTSSSSTSSSSSGASTTTSSSTTTTNTLPTSLVVEEGQQPDSVDPAADFTTAGNEVTFNVYQGLVAPNLQSTTQFVGVLAKNWTSSPDGMNWNFTLRHGVVFSNGDTFNAYVMWYSLYRSVVMNQISAFILGQNFAKSGSGFNVTGAMLNSMAYSNPSAANLSVMQAPNQSFQVLASDKIELHLGYGYNGNVTYSAFLVTLTAPIAFAVDPKVVSANGGVVDGNANTWMQTHAVGTGFYLLDSWTQGQDVKFVKNPSYWGNTYTETSLNYAIQPAVLNTIIIYYKPTSSRIIDLKSGSAQIIGAPDVTEAADLNTLRQTSGINVTDYPIQYGSALAAYFLFMNPFIVPAFSNNLVREAVSYAIDYNGIISSVFHGSAQQWVGPVPPGYPLYNETVAGISVYTHDVNKAALLMAKAGYKVPLQNGTTLNPGGQVFPTLSFVYSPDSTSENQVAPIIQSELLAIGINVNLTPMTFAQYTTYLFSPSSSGGTDGFGIGYWSEDYPASQDYVTGIAASNFTGAPTYFKNVSLWSATADSSLDSGTVLSAFRNITATMNSNYVDVWLYVPKFIAVNQANVVGMVPNLDGPCAGYFMYYNTVHYSS
jgi:peptide/nickel transport system substrate-binding protein